MSSISPQQSKNNAGNNFSFLPNGYLLFLPSLVWILAFTVAGTGLTSLCSNNSSYSNSTEYTEEKVQNTMPINPWLWIYALMLVGCGASPWLWNAYRKRTTAKVKPLPHSHLRSRSRPLPKSRTDSIFSPEVRMNKFATVVDPYQEQKQLQNRILHHSPAPAFCTTVLDNSKKPVSYRIDPLQQSAFKNSCAAGARKVKLPFEQLIK